MLSKHTATVTTAIVAAAERKDMVARRWSTATLIFILIQSQLERVPDYASKLGTNTAEFDPIDP
jgi:hypothetical protein